MRPQPPSTLSTHEAPETPKIVVFDLGKVLVNFDYGIAVKKIALHSTRSAEEIGHFLTHSPLLLRYEAGEVDTTAFFEAMREASGFKGDFDEFGVCFGDIFSPIPEMIELHARLRTARWPTYILSNTNDLAIRHIRRAFPFFQDFTGYILSYEVGVMKPAPAIYEALERASGQVGGRIVYLDDRPENVEPALARGWHAIVHESPEQSRKALTRLGLPV